MRLGQHLFSLYFLTAKLERQFQIGTRLIADNEAHSLPAHNTISRYSLHMYVRVIRDGCLGDNISAVNRQEPLSRLTYIVSKVGRGSRRLYWNGTDGWAGRCARPGQARPSNIRSPSRYIKRLQSSSQRLSLVCLLFWSCTPHVNTFHTRRIE